MPFPPRDSGAPLRLLLVEDSPFDARLVQAQLSAGPAPSHQLSHVASLSGALAALAEAAVDCVLLDLSLPDAEHLDGLSELLAAHGDVPVIVLSGHDESRLGGLAVQAGAQDYLAKGDVDGRALWRAVRYAVERKRAELQLRFQALHCSLTGLPNRVLLIDRLEGALGRLARRPGTVGVLFIDLDGFKWINDSLGHEVGDDVLVEVARRIDGVLQPADVAARHGGDEFILLTEAAGGMTEVASLAERLRGALDEPIHVAGCDLHVTASVGMAVTTAAGTTAASLLRNADAAMFRAKRDGKDRAAFFDESMRVEAARRVQLLDQLHRATERQEFSVVYQPVVQLDGGRLRGWEALLRWRRPDGTQVAPGEFVEVLEEHGLIVPVGDFVLSEAVSWLAAQHAALPAGAALPSVSVNLSAVQLGRPGLVRRVAELLESSGVPAQHLCLELTESQAVADGSAVRRLLELKGLGVRLSMDDYGTGYSALAQLRRLPFDTLKIDRSFVAGVCDVPADASICHAVIGMGRAMGLDVVAEGVEQAAQAAALAEYGCTSAQGFLFGRPSVDGALAVLPA